MAEVNINGRLYINPSRELLKADGVSEAKIQEVFDGFKWEKVRKTRDELIVKTDWTQFADAPLSEEKKAEFVVYRKSLREIPQTYSNPDDVVWPEKPTV